MQQLLAPLIRIGEVCWAEPSNWGSDPHITLCPNNGAVLQVALTPGSSEDLNVTVSGYLRVGQEVDGQWLPLLTAKVLTADDAGRIAGELLTLFSRAFIW